MEPGVEDPLESTPYRVLSTLGSGAMGEVYLAEHRALRKRVVVKILKAELSKSAKTLDRMRLEAQAVASLNHRNIVAALDFSATRDGRPFFVMEHLEGLTLLELVQRRGPQTHEAATAVIRQVLSGLAEAHRLGIIHRDVKPGNLFDCTDGVVKILDFGIAKVLAASESGPVPLAFPTDEGVALGSPRYLSPEQALGRAVDGRSDLYGTGAVLYYLLTARDPFHHRRGVFELLRAHAQESPAPPSTYVPDLPAAIDDLVLRALEKRPADRFRDASEFLRALDKAAREPGGPASARLPRWEKTIPIGPEVFRALRDAFDAPGDEPLSSRTAEPFRLMRRPKAGADAIDADAIETITPEAPSPLDEATTVPFAAAMSGGDPDAQTAQARLSPWAADRSPRSLRHSARARRIAWLVLGLLLGLCLLLYLLHAAANEIPWGRQ